MQGANSIVAYCSNAIFRKFIADSLITHANTFRPYVEDELRNLDNETLDFIYGSLGNEWATTATGAATLLVLWLMLFWMYRNKIFVRI